jgi:LPXTG-motif cell wall-anchored protein
MKPQLILGIALLALGAVLLVIGMNSSHSFVDQLSNTFTGRFTDNTTWYIAGGLVTAIVGLSLLFLGSRSKNA